MIISVAFIYLESIKESNCKSKKKVMDIVTTKVSMLNRFSSRRFKMKRKKLFYVNENV